MSETKPKSGVTRIEHGWMMRIRRFGSFWDRAYEDNADESRSSAEAMCETVSKILTKASGPERVLSEICRVKDGWKMTVGLQEHFWDSSYSKDPEKSKKAAEDRYKYLDGLLPPPNTCHRNVLTRKNSSGKPGVQLKPSTGRKGSLKTYWAYMAFWCENQRKQTHSFSIDYYGDDVAWDLACIARDHTLGPKMKWKVFELYSCQHRGTQLQPCRKSCFSGQA